MIIVKIPEWFASFFLLIMFINILLGAINLILKIILIKGA